MRLLKKTLPLLMATALAVLVAGCGAPAASPDATGVTTEELTSVTGTKYVVAGGVDQTINAELELEDGMSLYLFGRLDEGEIESAVSKDGELIYTDYLYDGYGFSVNDAGPGTYQVEILLTGVTGEFYLAAMPADQYHMEDFGSAEEVVVQVLTDIGEA